MLSTKCIHPEIVATLAHCGHGDKILIADGNYPLMSRSGNARKVYLGLERDIPTVSQVLQAIQSVAAFECATVMQPESGEEPACFSEFRSMLKGAEFISLERYAFYDACCGPDVVLAISTGESRTYANLLLTVGVC